MQESLFLAGKIVEDGTHEELLAKGKLYTHLYKLQFELTGSKELLDIT